MEGRDEAQRRGLTRLIAALLVLAGAIVAFVVADAATPEPQRVTAPHVAPEPDVVPVAADATVAVQMRAAAASGSTTEPAFLCTFVDGMPVPSLVRDVKAWGPADWSVASPRHTVPAEGDRLAVVARNCQIVVLARSEMPQRGERHIHMTRAPVLDVRLVNVPPTLRDRLRLQLQLDYGQLERGEHVASMLAGRGPFDMNEHRVLVPLVLPHRGRLDLHAVSRHSTHSYPAPKVPFEPVSQVIEIDLAVLAPACSLADLSLTVRFPYAHPSGEMDLSLLDADGSCMMYQRRVRVDEKQFEYRFRDLPVARVQPVLNHSKGTGLPWIPLVPIELKAGDNEAARDAVAESSLHVVLSGRDGLADDDVSVLLRTESGDGLDANWPRGNDTRFEHLVAGTLYAQAVAYRGRRCSPIVRVEIGIAQAHQLALQLVPAGQIEVAAGAFGAAVRHLDVHLPGQPPSRVVLCPSRHRTFWLPLGAHRVEWDGGSRTLRVEPGTRNRWP